MHKTSLIDYELKYGVPPDDDLGDIAADEPSNDDIADPDQHQQEVWRQPVCFSSSVGCRACNFELTL